MLIFFLAFGLFFTLIVFNGQITNFARAKEESIPSSETSLIFAWPLTAAADGKTPVEINVFIRNANNLPLSNKKVDLTTTLGAFSQSSGTTDKSGKASFSMTSTSTGLADITAQVDGQVQLKQKITVKFE